MTDFLTPEEKVASEVDLRMATRGFVVSKWIILVTGFMQSSAYENGLEMLWRRLRVQCNCKDTVVRVCHFTDDPAAMAEWITRTNRDMEHIPEINLIGYSFGGMTCVNIAREFHKRGETVNRLFLNDAVWRPRFVPAYSVHPAWLLSYIGIGKIKIPPNVKELWTWRQTMNRPRGSKVSIIDENATSWIQDSVLSFPNHQNMDELRTFHQTVTNIVCPLTQFRSPLVLESRNETRTIPDPVIGHPDTPPSSI